MGAVRGRAVKLVDETDSNVVADARQDLNSLTWIMESNRTAALAAYGANIRAAVKAAEANGEVNEVQLTVSGDYRRNAGLMAKRSAVVAGVRLGEILRNTLRN